jgi:xanthine/uracil permease
MALLLACCIGLILLDRATGPYVRVSAVFVIPVALAAYRWNWMIGLTVGMVLASSRLWLVLGTSASWLVLPELVNLGISLFLFAVVAVLAQRLRTRLTRATPSRVLAICGGCGRVREGSSGWRRLERLAPTIAAARFVHTVCPECESRYGSAPAARVPGTR